MKDLTLVSGEQQPSRPLCFPAKPAAHLAAVPQQLSELSEAAAALPVPHAFSNTLQADQQQTQTAPCCLCRSSLKSPLQRRLRYKGGK